MIWLYKFILLFLVIGITGFAQFEKVGGDDSEAADVIEVEAASISILKESQKITTVSEEMINSKPFTAYRHTGFKFISYSPLKPILKEFAFQMCSPLASVPLAELESVVSDPYNPPIMGSDERHQGTDFAYYRRYDRATIAGDVVQSIFGGKVISVVEDKFPYGNAVIVETPHDMLTAEIQETIGIHDDQSVYVLFGHLESLAEVKIGDEIGACQPVGTVGKTGNTGVEHLHLEMRIGPSGEIITSMGCYVPEATKAEREAYRYWRTSGTFMHFDPMNLLDTTP